jgi:hypothetical protein
MADETNIAKSEPTSPSRRAVVTRAAQVAVTAPAVALLLNASTKSAFAQCAYFAGVAAAGCGPPILDDFTFSNSEEDIDAIVLGSNFNPFNGQPSQDDQI